MSNELYKEYENEKHITVGDYVKLYGMNDKTEILIVNNQDYDDILFNGRIDYLQYASEGCMHDLCNLEIKAFLDSITIAVDLNNYNGRTGIY